MDEDAITFNALPKQDSRKAGFEFELSGLTVEDCAELVKQEFGGTVEPNHSLEVEIKDTDAGTFRVEMDSHLMKDMAESLEEEQPETKDQLIDTAPIRESISQAMGSFAGQFVPLEIVTPPLAFDQFDKLERLREQLCQQKAKGTRDAPVNAFGMHINAQIPSEDIEGVLPIFKAFLILYPWLKQQMKIDFSRRCLTYIDPFPKAYIQLVLAEDYQPSWKDFITDYLEHNPTRNRALDMLPIFSHIDDSLLDKLDEKQRVLVNARPAFHYRLPNCEVDNPDWHIARDWNLWVKLEEVAGDAKLLGKLACDYLEFLDAPLHLTDGKWAEQLNEELS
jgi:hypothetical protein